MPPRAHFEVRAALSAIEGEDATLADKVEMLMEMAMGLQTRPKSPAQIRQAVALYEKALELCPADHYMLRGRLHAHFATALQAIPGDDLESLTEARRNLEAARDILKLEGLPQEIAEIEMNLGLVLQSLASVNAAPICDSGGIRECDRQLRQLPAQSPGRLALSRSKQSASSCAGSFEISRGRGNFRRGGRGADRRGGDRGDRGGARGGAAAERT